MINESRQKNNRSSLEGVQKATLNELLKNSIIISRKNAKTGQNYRRKVNQTLHKSVHWNQNCLNSDLLEINHPYSNNK